jgi:hypothetical protein
MELVYTAEVTLLKRFHSTSTQHTLQKYLSVLCCDPLWLIPVSDLGIQNAGIRLSPTTSDGLGDTPGSTITRWSTILVPVLKYIFSLSVSEKHFPAHWMQSVIVPPYKKISNSLLRNYRPVYHLFSIIFKICEIIMHDHLSHYFKYKLNLRQPASVKSKCTIINLMSFLDYRIHPH